MKTSQYKKHLNSRTFESTKYNMESTKYNKVDAHNLLNNRKIEPMKQTQMWFDAWQANFENLNDYIKKSNRKPMQYRGNKVDT